MTNVEKLARLDMLGDMRQRYGAANSNDSSYDDEINELSNDTIMREWCAWKIGDGYWWELMKEKFDSLEELSGKKRLVGKDETVYFRA